MNVVPLDAQFYPKVEIVNHPKSLSDLFPFCYVETFEHRYIFSQFANDLSNNIDFIRLVVGKIDPSQANYLVCEILRGHLNFFHRPNITEVLSRSNFSH